MNTIEFIAIVIVSLILCSTFGLSIVISDIEDRLNRIEFKLMDKLKKSEGEE